MGSCGNGPDQMAVPRQLDVDPTRGVAYVADTGHSRVVEWDLNTKHIVATFSGPIGSRSLNFPRGVALDPTRTWLYIGDSGNNRVVRVHTDLSASSAVVVTTGADTPEQSFGGPEWLTFSGNDGRLFLSDNNQVIYAFTITG
jgi:DNA-binding beta-propeller fold protein YncE